MRPPFFLLILTDDLPLPDQVADDDHPAAEEPRQHSIWSEGQMWRSPERHGQITGIMKAQADLPSRLQGSSPNAGPDAER